VNRESWELLLEVIAVCLSLFLRSLGSHFTGATEHWSQAIQEVL